MKGNLKTILYSNCFCPVSFVCFLECVLFPDHELSLECNDQSFNTFSATAHPQNVETL